MFVDHAVAVVVDAVALLGCRRLHRPHAAVVAGHRVVADPGADSGAGAAADGAGLADLERFVRLAVAVVVETVATELGVLDRLVGRGVVADPSRLAAAGRLRARADALRQAGDGGRLQVVVDDAVAVVVEPVTGLDAAVGLDALGLAAGNGRVAVVEVRQAGPLLANAVLAAGRRERERAGVVARAAVVDVAHDVEAVVDGAVAVVVDAVADLDAAVRLGALAPVRRIVVGVEESRLTGELALAGDTGGDRVRDDALVKARPAVRDVRLQRGRVRVAELNAAVCTGASQRCRRSPGCRRGRRRRRCRRPGACRRFRCVRRSADCRCPVAEARRSRRRPLGTTLTPKS